MAATNPGGRELPMKPSERAEAFADAPSSQRPRNVYLLPLSHEDGEETMTGSPGGKETRRARGVYRDPTKGEGQTSPNYSRTTSSSFFSRRPAREAQEGEEKKEEEEEVAAAAAGVREMPPRVGNAPNSFSPLLEHRKVVSHTRVGGRISRRSSVNLGTTLSSALGGERKDEAEEGGKGAGEEEKKKKKEEKDHHHHPSLVPPSSGPISAPPSRVRWTEAMLPSPITITDPREDGEGESAIARRRRRRPPLLTDPTPTASNASSIHRETTMTTETSPLSHSGSMTGPTTTTTTSSSASVSSPASSSRSGEGSVPSAGKVVAEACGRDGNAASASSWTEGMPTTAGAPPPRPRPLHREMFESLNYRADHFANELLQRYLNYYITHVPVYTSGTNTYPPSTTSPDGRGSHGAASPPPDPTKGEGEGAGRDAKEPLPAASAGSSLENIPGNDTIPRRFSSTSPSTDPTLYYAHVAHALGDVLRGTLQEVQALAISEERTRRGKEMQAKRVEWEERRHLAHVRTTGLQETTVQLQQYEQYIHNAQAATAGIVQHLTQTNARVQRGKAIGLLLKHFRMFVQIPTPTLRHALSLLSPKRDWQRRAVTAWWEYWQARDTTTPYGTRTSWPTSGGGGGGGDDDGDASLALPDACRRWCPFYDFDAGVEEAMLGILREHLRQGKRRPHAGHPLPPAPSSSSSPMMGGGGDGGGGSGSGSGSPAVAHRTSNELGKGSPSVVPPSSSSSSSTTTTHGAGPVESEEAAVGKRKRRKVVVKTKKIRHGAGEGEPQDRRSTVLPTSTTTTDHTKRKIVRHGPSQASLPTVAAIRAAESAAAQAGLDPQFIARRATESQTDWCQRLRLLSSELAEEVEKVENITHYTRWLQEELALDVFYLIERYRVNGEHYPASVLPSLPLGKALLSSLELVSRLYVKLAASVEELFVLCISHVVENLRGTLEAEYVPAPYVVTPSEGGGGPLPVGTTLVPSRISSPTTTSSGGSGVPAVPLSPTLPSAVPGSTSSPEPRAKTSKETTISGPSAPTPLLAMEHFSRYTASAFPRILGFLTERVRREGFIAEALSGSYLHDPHSSLAFQQLLSQVVEKVVHPLLAQQIQLAESHKDDMLRREVPLSPRSRRRHVPRVLDAMVYRSTMLLHGILFYQDLQLEFEKDLASPQDARFLHPLGEAIFRAPRSRYVQQREELTLLRRTYTYLDESYTRALHAMPEEVFDVRPAHHAKVQAMLEALVDSTARVRMVLTHEKEVLPMTIELVECSIRQLGQYFSGELQKAVDSVRGEREKWRVKPKSESELLRPTKPEAQQCGFRMLWFIQNALGMVQESLSTISAPLSQQFPRLKVDLERLRADVFANLEELAETLLNGSVNAMISSALSILMHYQQKNDFLVTEKSKPAFASGSADGGTSASGSSPTSRAAQDHHPMASVVPPCTRACTLFCQYITRQFSEAREMIEQSEVMAAAEGSGGGAGGGGTGGRGGGGGGEGSDGDFLDPTVVDSDVDGVVYGRNRESIGGAGSGRWLPSSAKPAAELCLAKARSMSMAELLYGDGDTSGYTFVRVVGVCLFRGIGAHLKSFVVNDLGALVYKQDVTAYAEVMRPLSTTPTLSGAVVKVLFRMLRETSGLMLMPLDHIKEVKDSGMLQVMHPAEKLAFLKIREDVRIAFRMINK